MNKLASLIESIGTDTETIDRIKWLLSLDESVVTELIHESKNSTLDKALVQIGKKRQLWENSAPISTSILNDYLQKHGPISLNERVQIEFGFIHIEALPSAFHHRNLTVWLKIYLDNELSYSNDSLKIDSHYVGFTGCDKPKGFVQKFAKELIRHIKVKYYMASDDPLEMALTFEMITKDLQSVIEIFKALDRDIYKLSIEPVGLFLSGLWRTSTTWMWAEQHDTLNKTYENAMSKAIY